MKNTFGNNVSVTIFGESHGEYIGAVLDGLGAGLKVDTEFIKSMLKKRRPSGAISTPRVEADEFIIASGVFEGKTTGAPITILIPNTNTKSADYQLGAARPSHADYTAHIKYAGNQDFRGGGHFSGRLTAALVAVGAICILALKQKGVKIATHILSIGQASDRAFLDIDADIDYLNSCDFAVLDKDAEQKMMQTILDAKADGDSVGGVLETVISGMPAGVGEPWFDTVEGVLAHALFSIPAIKGVEFGAGFDITKLRGSQANDPICNEGGKIITKTNNNGGINGGITNGMPIIVKTAVKPTPTIFKEQDTIDLNTLKNTKTSPAGRHDPCIVHRARVVCDCVCAIAICDMLGNV